MRNTLYKPFEIEIKNLDHFPERKRKINFFELIYVVSGTGVQHVNGNQFSYKGGNLFLLTPEDAYSFDIFLPTCFFFIRFNDYYIRNDKDTVQCMESILQNASHRPGCILKNKTDKPLVAFLMKSMMAEQEHQQIYFTRITEQIVNTIITIVARNIALKLPKKIKENTGELVLEMLHFIQQHIFEPTLLSVERLSTQFKMAPNYLGRYFKKQTGDTLQGYIANYKVRLIEARLLHSNMRINEIAIELHFTDESHLNRTFKKIKGMSPTAFRKQYLTAGSN